MLIFVNVPTECGARGLSESFRGLFSLTLNHHTVIPDLLCYRRGDTFMWELGNSNSELVHNFPYRLATYSYLISSDFFGTTLFQWSDSGGGGWMLGMAVLGMAVLMYALLASMH